MKDHSDPSQANLSEKFKNVLLLLILATLLFFSTQLFASILVQPLSQYISSQNVLLFCYSLTSLAVLLIMLQFNNKKKTIRERVGLNKIKWIDAGRVVPVLLIYLVLSITLTQLVVRFVPGFNSDQAQNTGFSHSLAGLELAVAFISLVVITPIVEEMIFRGILFRGLRKDLPFLASAIVTSMLFGLAHAQWNLAIDTFALSLALCYLAEKSDSIIPSILLHATKNLMAFIFLFVIK